MRKKRTNSEPPEEPDTPKEEVGQTLLQQIQAIPADQWAGKRVYLYRVFPIIDKKGDDHFIAKLSESFDEDYLLRNWGSGRYHLRLNDAQGHTLATQNIAVHNAAFPPKVDPLEVVESDPRNRVYFDVWGRRSAKTEPASADTSAVGELAKLAGKVLEQKNGSPAPNGISEATTQLLLGMSKGRDELAEKLASHPSASADPIAAVDRLADLIKKIQPDGKHVDPITALREAVDLIRTVQPSAAPVDPITQFKGFLEMLKQTKELVGVPQNAGVIESNVRSRMAGWQEMIQPAIPVVVDFLKPFAAGLAANLFARAGQPAPPPAVVNGTAPPPAQSAAAPQAQPQNGAMPPLLNMIAPAMLNYMRVEADPQELGEDFASWVHEGYQADPRFNSAIGMARAGGPGMIIAQFKGSPWWMDKGPNHDQLSLAEMEGKFGMFVQAFLNWQPGAEVEESGTPEVISIG